MRDAAFEVDVGPAEAERLPDAKPCHGEQFEEESVAAGVFEQTSEIIAFQDRDALGIPARFLAWLEARDGVGPYPSAPQREATALVERFERDHRRCWREHPLVRL